MLHIFACCEHLTKGNAMCGQVLASHGHVRDLPAKQGSVVPEEDFAMHWQLSTSSRPRLKELIEAVKQAQVFEETVVNCYLVKEHQVGASKVY